MSIGVRSGCSSPPGRSPARFRHVAPFRRRRGGTYNLANPDSVAEIRALSDSIQILVTALHLTAVNAAFSGPILSLWLFLRSCRNPNSDVADLGRSLLRGSLFGFYAGMALGVVAALIWWGNQERAVERAFHALPIDRYYFTVAELIFSAVVLEAWAALWRRNADHETSRNNALMIGLAFVGITNTAYHFPSLFTVLSVLSTRIPAGEERFVSLLIDPEVIARIAHFALASFAVGGAMLAALAAARKFETADDDDVRTIFTLQRRGALIALVATLLQWPVGILVVLQLPEASRDALIGQNAAVTVLFAVSLCAVVMLMHRMAAAAFGGVSPAEMRSLLLWLGITIMLMTAVRHFSRAPLYDAVAHQIPRQTVS